MYAMQHPSKLLQQEDAAVSLQILKQCIAPFEVLRGKHTAFPYVVQKESCNAFVVMVLSSDIYGFSLNGIVSARRQESGLIRKCLNQ